VFRYRTPKSDRLLAPNMKVAYVNLRNGITPRAPHHLIASTRFQINPDPANFSNGFVGKQPVRHQAKWTVRRTIHNYFLRGTHDFSTGRFACFHAPSPPDKM